VLTDNRNRTAAELRATFTRAGGNLGEPGSVAWQFESRGVITVNAEGTEAEAVELAAIDAGAEDITSEDGTIEIITTPTELETVRRALVEKRLAVASAEPAMVAKTTVELGDREAEQVLRLLDRLEELDDVQRVHSNAEFSDAVLAGLQD